MIRCVRDLGKQAAAKYRPEDLKAVIYGFPGETVELKSNSSSLISLLDRIYRCFRSDGTADSTLYLLQDQGESGVRFLAVDPGFNSFICTEPDQAVSFWGSQLMVDHLYRSRSLYLHSAVLGRDGKVHLFPGGSRSGKTTLALKLSRAGYTYFSEEMAPLDVESGKVNPFPRSFLLRSDSLRLLPGVREESDKLPFFYDYQERASGEDNPPKRFIFSPTRLFSKVGGEALPVGGIFFLSGFCGGATRFRPLSSARALQLLVEYAVNPGYLDPPGGFTALETLISLAGRAPAFRVELGQLDEEPEALSRSLEEAMERGYDRRTGDLKLVARRCRQLFRQKATLREGSNQK